jgi:predicted RNase H-like nuclease (RuvC/YqgF family)
MTKEELEKEAEEFTDSKKSFWRQGRTCIDSVKQAYLAGAEPREKQIEIDAKQIRALQKQNGELTDKVRELENTLENIRYYLDNEIPHDLINEATTKIWRMLK